MNRNIDIEPVVPIHPWMEEARCGTGHDPEMWFDESITYEGKLRRQEAKRICGLCAVNLDCLNYATSEHQDYGIYAGLEPHERKRMNSIKRSLKNYR